MERHWRSSRTTTPPCAPSGERLRRDGVPVRYSSVTRPLKDEPFVQGLFALIELARLRRTGASAMRMGTGTAAAYVRSRVVSLMGSPLIHGWCQTGRRARGAPRTGRIGDDCAWCRCPPSSRTASWPMTETVPKTVLMGTASMAPLRPLGIRPRRAGRNRRPIRAADSFAWPAPGRACAKRWTSPIPDSGTAAGRTPSRIDDRLVDSGLRIPGEDDVPLSLDALYVMLAFDERGGAQ